MFDTVTPHKWESHPWNEGDAWWISTIDPTTGRLHCTAEDVICDPDVCGANNGIFQLYEKPGLEWLKPLYSTFEARYESMPGAWLAWNYWWFPWAACALYLTLIVLGTKYFENRKPWGLRNTLGWWNVLLSVFSWAGALHVVPHLMYNIKHWDFKDTICVNPYCDWGRGGTGFWVQMFVFSKVPELVDTFFIVVRKKKLIFLHWYHHVTVLLYCWHSYYTMAPQSLYFIAMNYCVHAVMYGYFACMAFKCLPKWFPPIVVTAMQIGQMIVGVGIQISAMYYYVQSNGEYSKCAVDPNNLIAGALMYGSYLYLFLQFAIQRFFFGVGTDTNKTSGEEAKKVK